MSDTKKTPVTKKIAGILRAVAGTPDPKNFTSAVICAAGSSTRTPMSTRLDLVGIFSSLQTCSIHLLPIRPTEIMHFSQR